MSRNKIIKTVHNVTGKSYAECRAICKMAHWDEQIILSYCFIDSDKLQKIFEGIKTVAAGVFDALANATAALSDAFASLSESLIDTPKIEPVKIEPEPVNVGALMRSIQQETTNDLLTGMGG